jgi:hypothetical protein
MEHIRRPLLTQADQTAVWTFLIVRKPRDRDNLSADLAAGDQLAALIIHGIGSWLWHWRRSPAAKAPPCMSCGRPFRRPRPPPDVFCIAYTEDRRVRPNVETHAVCKSCARAKSDTELLIQAGEVCDEIFGFRMIGGPSSSSSSNSVH